VLLPEKGVGSVLEGTVVAVGPGARDKVRIVVFHDMQISLWLPCIKISILPFFSGTDSTEK